MYQSAVDVKDSDMNKNTHLLASGLALSIPVGNSNSVQVIIVTLFS